MAGIGAGLVVLGAGFGIGRTQMPMAAQAVILGGNVRVGLEDNSEWKPMAGVSDLTRIKRQQYVVVQLINELKSFESLNEVNKLIKALENTFIIDESLTINKAAELLWSFRDFDITKVNKITTPTDYLTLQDGRQVLVLNQSLYNFLIKESIIDS